MSVWAARDPRGKALAAMLGSLGLAVAPGSRVLIGIPVVALLVASAGLDAARLRRLLRAVLVLWVLSFLANAFLVPGERLGPEGWGWVRPTREGLRAGVGQGGRLAALAGLGVWIAATTGIFDLARSLEWGVRRTPALRRRVHRWVLPAVLAVRLLPTLGAEARRLHDVDRLRGGGGGLRHAARLVPVWLMLVVEQADHLALALTLRGYGGDAGRRGFARSYRFGPGDWALVAGGVVAAILLVRP